MAERPEQYDILNNGFAAVWLRRDIVRATGDDVISYLQGQLTQDMDKVAIGDLTLSWVLQPHGKVDAFVRLYRTGENEVYLDIDAGFVDLLLERLNRFKLNTKVEFEQLPWKALGLRGAKAAQPDQGELVMEIEYPGFCGYDVWGTDLTIPEEATECEFDLYEATRIEAGVPRMGTELDQLTIPAEAGLNDKTISFAKGCYTGQELTARIESRGGNVPRNLRTLVIDSDEAPPTGSKIMPPGATATSKPYGTITSSAYSPRLKKAVALAFIRREIQPGANGVVDWDRGPSACTIEKPPLT